MVIVIQGKTSKDKIIKRIFDNYGKNFPDEVINKCFPDKILAKLVDELAFGRTVTIYPNLYLDKTDRTYCAYLRYEIA